MTQLATIPATMWSLVVTAPGEFHVTETPVPAPGPMEALCRVRSVAICGTDTHIIEGHLVGFWPPAYPFTPGHEWAGEIVALGEGAGDLGWSVGDRVAGSSHAGCGYCRKCQLGRYNLCENYGQEGIHSQYGHTVAGAYATYVVHSLKSLTPLPEAIDFDTGAMLDTTSIAMHTVNRSRLRPGEEVAVIGAGVLGLLAAECAQAAGAGRVIVVGRGSRLQVAAKLGFEVIDTASGDPVAAVREATHGRGVEVALECAGGAETVRWGVEMLRKGGRLSMVGIPLSEAALPIREMVLYELEVLGTRANAGEMSDVVPLVESGRVRASELITHRFALSEFADAYRTFTGRVDGALKVIVNP